MIDAGTAALGLLAGLALGTVFFGGLWLTTRRLSHSRNVFALVLGSFAGRSVISLAGLFLVIRFAGFSGVIGALVGFVVMQVVFLRLSMKRTGPGCPR
jgi:F1F0 ATPase subunit 2